MRAAGFVRTYYDALRRGDPLSSYFLESDSTVKFGVGESLFGYDDVSTALREQTRTTDEWVVESDHLVVDERANGAVATFADEVRLEWTDGERDEHRAFDTRWSGTAVRREAGGVDPDSSAAGADAETHATPPWAFATMHVSAAREL